MATITIFLIDDEPNGLRTAELSNWTGKAIVIPRNKLGKVKDRPECNEPSVYFLIGKENEEDLLFSVYIGEAENLWNRLSTHDSTKSFWQIAVAFTSKDESLTKAHVKYLESGALDMARKVKRFKIKNDASSNIPRLPESDRADMKVFFYNLNLLLTALGYPVLQSIVSKKSDNIPDPLFICKGKGAEATGRLTNEGFVIYKGSTAAARMSNAVVGRNQRIIDKLLKNGYLNKKDNALYIFIEDYVFNSPSAASDIVLGNSTSGWKKWKTQNNKTLEEVYKNK